MRTKEQIIRKLRRNFNLRDYQEEHCANCIQLITKNYGYIDTSDRGLGKTHTTLTIIKYFSKRALIIGPPGSEKHWREVAEEIGVVIDFVTQDAIRSKKSKNRDDIRTLEHGYLIRNDSSSKTSFTVTMEFEKFVRDGGVVVVDECHSVRNSTSARHKAVKTLINYLVSIPRKWGATPKYILLTASPLTTHAQTLSFLRLIGFIRSEDLYIKGPTGSTVLVGLKELIDVCMSMDPGTTASVVKTYNAHDTNTSKELVHRLFAEVVKHHITAAIKPPKLKIKINQRNVYYDLDEENRDKFMKSLEDLKLAARFNERTGKSNRARLVGTSKEENVTTKRRKTELCKLPVFARVVKKQLLEDENCKVIVGVHFRDTLHMLAESLSEYNPIVIHGSVKNHGKRNRKRDELVRRFQEDPKSRLLIAIVRVIAESISLHDTVGDQPRHTFLSPTYELLLIYQACGRTVRDGNNTKSDVSINIVYIKGGDLEMRIYSSLARKSDTLEDTLTHYNKDMLPSNFEVVYE